MLAPDPLPVPAPISKTSDPVRGRLAGFGVALAVRWERWRARVISLFAGQLAVQLLGFATGMVLMRWMSVDAFAQYGVAFGFQCMLGAFVDLGFSGSIVSLVGPRGDQPEVIGGYIAAARWWRRALMTVLTPLAAIAFYYINLRQGWPLAGGLVLFACIVLTLYVSGWNAWASAPLLIHQRVSQMYRSQIAAGIARLAACGVLFVLRSLNAVTLTLVNTAVAAGIAWSYWQAARPYFAEPPSSAPKIRREMQRYLAPLLPSVIFFALQGQLSTLLISWFGHSQSVAEVAALGRLAQLFTLLGAIHGTLVVPYFARLARGILPGRYVLTLGASLALAAALTLASFLFPNPILWLLGAKYRHLQAELGWMVLANSMGFVGGVLWSIHSARKWIFWSGTFLYISLITLTQIVFIAFVRMDSTLHVLHLSVATNVAVLGVHAYTAWMGFRWKGDHDAEAPTPPPLPTVP